MVISTNKRRSRIDPRKEATRVAIVESAETLFAHYGIEGVSLRQIGRASGSSNTGVVAYHFGSKESLVEAVFHYRLPSIETRRRELLHEVRDLGQEGDTYFLLWALCLPLFEQVNEDGLHTFAGFLSALIHSPMGGIRLAMNINYPISAELSECLKNSIPTELLQNFESRIKITTVMVTGVLKVIDQANRPEESLPLFEDTLRMASAALLAPVGV